jgi:DNA-binding ferritin-like protein (Dps family)
MVAQHSKEELEGKLKEWTEYQHKVHEKGDEFRKELNAITSKILYTKKDADRVKELVEEFAKVMHEMPKPL